jgi:hypothetical protein
MDRRDELIDGDETGIRAEGRVTQKPTDAPVPIAPVRDSHLPRFRRIETALIPWLTIPSMCLGGGSVSFQIQILIDADKSTKSLSVFLTSPGGGEVFFMTPPMAASAIPLGLLGYWLARRETARAKKELVYPSSRPVTIQSHVWALVGVATGVLGLIIGAIIQSFI